MVDQCASLSTLQSNTLAYQDTEGFMSVGTHSNG